MPRTVEEIRELVRENATVRVASGRSKSALSRAMAFGVGGLSGVVEYDPQEFTITARAGTTVSEVHDLLLENRQYLPFDPPMRLSGATLAGTVAAGLSGPGRFHYGGVRDFILGVEFISGSGKLLRGGGKVVKNAAGFDFPKLMVGALGEFGVLTEVTFKVFPKPQANRTLRLDTPDIATAVALVQRIVSSPLQPGILELHPPGTVYLRLSGSAAASRERLRRALEFLPPGVTVLNADESRDLWQAEREYSWVPTGHGLVKIALTPTQIQAVDAGVESLAPGALRRYGLGGNVLLLAWPAATDVLRLEALLQRHRLSALPITGDWPASRLGVQPGREFAERIRRVLDPEGKFRRRSLSEKAR